MISLAKDIGHETLKWGAFFIAVGLIGDLPKLLDRDYPLFVVVALHVFISISFLTVFWLMWLAPVATPPRTSVVFHDKKGAPHASKV